MTDAEVFAKVRELCEAATDWPPDNLVVRSPETDWMDFFADPERGKLILDFIARAWMPHICRGIASQVEKCPGCASDALMASMREGLK